MHLFPIRFLAAYEELGSKRAEESPWIRARDGKGRGEERWTGMITLFVVNLAVKEIETGWYRVPSVDWIIQKRGSVNERCDTMFRNCQTGEMYAMVDIKCCVCCVCPALTVPRNASFIHWKIIGLVDYLFRKKERKYREFVINPMKTVRVEGSSILHIHVSRQDFPSWFEKCC